MSTATAGEAVPGRPFRRKLFYVGGFDPRGVRWYDQLYRDQVARFAAATGHDADVAPRRRADRHTATWVARDRTAGCETDYAFLRWEDIVRRAWITNPLALVARAARTYWNHARHGDWRWVRRHRSGTLLTLAYPPLLTVLLPLSFGGLAAALLALLLPAWAAIPLGVALGAVAAVPLLHKVKAFWLLRFFVFNGELAGGIDHPELALRLDRFADRIVAALAEDWDEVLVVAHSNGSILAVPLLDRVLALVGGDLPDRFALVTLGECIPLVACRRDATGYRAALARVAQGRFRWLDIGSPTDGAAFALVDPLAIVVPGRKRTAVEAISPRWFRFYDATRYRAHRRDKYEVHFDYLRMGDRPSPLDYPSLTLAPRPLAASIAAFKAIR